MIFSPRMIWQKGCREHISDECTMMTASQWYSPWDINKLLAGWHCMKYYCQDIIAPHKTFNAWVLPPTNKSTKSSVFDFPFCLAECISKISDHSKIRYSLVKRIICNVNRNCFFKIYYDNKCIKKFIGHLWNQGIKCVYKLLAYSSCNHNKNA